VSCLDLVAHPGRHRKGFDTLRPAADYDGLCDAARGRSRADGWWENLSRAYTLAYDESLRGRVQTRHGGGRNLLSAVSFRKLPEVQATFRPTDAKIALVQRHAVRERSATPAAPGADKESLQQSMRLPLTAKRRSASPRARSGQAAIESSKPRPSVWPTAALRSPPSATR
jgi:hypothetical protein